MQRHCNGEDLNLIMYMHKDGTRCTAARRRSCSEDEYTPQPCDCGLTFDDINRLTVFPHARF
jgi:hypothetical protein